MSIWIKIRSIAAKSLVKRRVHVLIFLVIVVILILTARQTYYSSGRRDHVKQSVLLMMGFIYLLQSVLNHRLLWKVLLACYVLLQLWFIYSFVYIFFDPYDHIGLHNSLGGHLLVLIIKLLIGCIPLIATCWMKPSGGFAQEGRTFKKRTNFVLITFLVIPIAFTLGYVIPFNWLFEGSKKFAVVICAMIYLASLLIGGYNALRIFKLEGLDSSEKARWIGLNLIPVWFAAYMFIFNNLFRLTMLSEL